MNCSTISLLRSFRSNTAWVAFGSNTCRKCRASLSGLGLKYPHLLRDRPQPAPHQEPVPIGEVRPVAVVAQRVKAMRGPGGSRTCAWARRLALMKSGVVIAAVRVLWVTIEPDRGRQAEPARAA